MTGLTDEEWREFQKIPDQGYSHRAWIDAKIEAARAEGWDACAKEIRDDCEYSWINLGNDLDPEVREWGLVVRTELLLDTVAENPYHTEVCTCGNADMFSATECRKCGES